MLSGKRYIKNFCLIRIKISSLSKNEDFKYILGGKKISSKYITIFYRKLTKMNPGSLNISFVTKKKLGNAIVRNKIKRRLRNIMNDALKKLILITNILIYLWQKKMYLMMNIY